MKMLETQDFGYRRVVRVLTNPEDAHWLHDDGLPAPADHTGDTEETGKTLCHDCRDNWRIEEVTFTREELTVNLNKWGNPVHDSQDGVSTRSRTWDELYQEVDGRLGQHVLFGDAPRQAAPKFTPELEPDFELIMTGEPYMEDALAIQAYQVLRLGVRAAGFKAEGADGLSFAMDRETKYGKAQEEILARESGKATALAITS